MPAHGGGLHTQGGLKNPLFNVRSFADRAQLAGAHPSVDLGSQSFQDVDHKLLGVVPVLFFSTMFEFSQGCSRTY